MFFLIAKDNEWAGLLSSLDMFSNEFTEKKIPYQTLHWYSSQT